MIEPLPTRLIRIVSLDDRIVASQIGRRDYRRSCSYYHENRILYFSVRWCAYFYAHALRVSASCFKWVAVIGLLSSNRISLWIIVRLGRSFVRAVGYQFIGFISSKWRFLIWSSSMRMCYVQLSFVLAWTWCLVQTLGIWSNLGNKFFAWTVCRDPLLFSTSLQRLFSSVLCLVLPVALVVCLSICTTLWLREAVHVRTIAATDPKLCSSIFCSVGEKWYLASHSQHSVHHPRRHGGTGYSDTCLDVFNRAGCCTLLMNQPNIIFRTLLTYDIVEGGCLLESCVLKFEFFSIEQNSVFPLVDRV